MATNGQFTITYGSYTDAVFTWERTSYSVDNKTSTISWSVKTNSYNAYHSAEVNVKINEAAVSGSSGTYILQHDGASTADFTVYLKITDYAIVGTVTSQHSKEGTQTFTVDGVPQPAVLIEAPNFNDEDNPTIIYSNPSGTAITELQACIEFSGGAQTVKYRNISKTGSTYTFPLTEEERVALRQGIAEGNTRSIRFTLRTFIKNTYYYSTITRTLELYDHEPILNPTFRDANTTTAALTGDATTKFVRYASDLSYAMRASARKEATLIERYVKCGGYEKVDKDSDIIYGVDGDSIHFQVTDSRGFKVEKDYKLDMIPYVKLTAALRVITLTLEGNLTFTLDGNYYDGSFGAADNQLSISYELKKNGLSVGVVALDPNTQGEFTYRDNKYHYEYVVTGLTALEADGTHNSYSIITTVKDKVSGNIVSEETTVSAVPVFDWGKNDFRFNVPVHFGRGFTSDVGLKTATNTPRTIHIDSAGAHFVGSLSDMGINYSENNIYSVTGTIFAESSKRYYPLPIPTLTLGVLNTPAYDLREAARLWIENDDIYITTGAAWGYVRISVVIQYF